MNSLSHTLAVAAMVLAAGTVSAQLVATPNAAPALGTQATKPSADQGRSLADVLKATSAAAPQAGHAEEQERRRRESSLFVSPAAQPQNAKTK